MKSGQKYLIVDCYVDEPACFGVPPFIAPYPRYVFGALVDAGIDPSLIEYRTIDRLRADDYVIHENFNAVFVIGGAVVPGKYIHARIGTQKEIQTIIMRNTHCPFFLGGAIGRKSADVGCRNAYEIKGDIEFFAHYYAQSRPAEGERSITQIARWSVCGAPVVLQHPEYPYLICEMETYRGCPRLHKCHFCQEYLRAGVMFRDESHILDEIDALIECGISRFRLGSQPDIIQYGSLLEEFRNGFPKPNPSKTIPLCNALKERRTKGRICLLHVDNANPGSIAHFPDESAEIIYAIAEMVTPGDTLALGIESFDQTVIRINNLKVTPNEALFAVKMINQICGVREEGIPKLLPGINLIHGLPGESEETFKFNYEYLRTILNMGLLVKRINIRSVEPVAGTPVGKSTRIPNVRVRKRYEYFREKIRREIDMAMLKKIYPPGTVLCELRVETIHCTYTYARQIASYPIAVKIPYPFDNNDFFNAVVLAHQERSLVAIPSPFDINSLPYSALKYIPGLGTKGAEQLILQRPLDIARIQEYFPNVPELLLKCAINNRSEPHCQTISIL